jgi:hypothetical protein
MTTPLDHEHELDQHLRRTLAAIAATVHEAPERDVASVPRRSRRRRRLLMGAGVTIATIPLAAAAVVRFGPEYVDRIPPANPIISGSLDGERYWVVDGREIPRCERFPSGVELIAEEDNIVGQEWNTFGYFFGEPTTDGCAPRLADDPPEFTYYSDGGSLVGDGMLWMGALHPDVDQVRVSLSGGEPFDAETFEHEGGAYFVLEVPPGTATFTVDYLVDGKVLVPPSGDGAEHVVPID